MCAYRKFTSSAGNQIIGLLPKVLNEVDSSIYCGLISQTSWYLCLVTSKGLVVSKSFILVRDELLPEGAWTTFQVGRGTVLYTALRSGHLLNTALLLARVEFWVSSD